MKAVLAIAAVIALESCGNKDLGADPSQSGALSHLLDYHLVFKSDESHADSHFVVTLSNVSDRKLSVQVNDTEFHASLMIYDSSGESREVFLREYLGLLLTSTWAEPVVDLSPGQEIRWNVPLGSLVGLNGQPVTIDAFLGCEVTSKMTIAIVPGDRTYVSDNASKESERIAIPNKG